jgi:hypothetical protein
MDNLGNVVELHDREIIINRGSWEYQNFKMFGIKIISEISKSEYKVELQIDDTGVSVNYFFEIDNDKWYLIKIVDESM